MEVLTPCTSSCGLMRSFGRAIIQEEDHPNKKENLDIVINIERKQLDYDEGRR